MNENHRRATDPTAAETPVLIVGGGLAGLSAALFLSWHGVKPLLVEKHPDLLIHPRARGFTQRTVELFRKVGLEPEIRAASYATGDDFRWIAVRAETLAGEHDLAEEPPEETELRHLSPAPFAPIDQDRLEIILRSKAEDLDAEVQFSTELVSFEQDADGVSALLRDRRTGTEQMVRAQYLLAADGWDSPIRERLRIGLDGPGTFFNTITALIDADLRPALRGRRINIAYLQQPRPGTIVMAHDDTGQRWVFGTGYAPQLGESVTDFTADRIIEFVRQATGLPDVVVSLRPQIPGTDLNVLGFTIGAQVAQRFRHGRVFLVGDAAHIVPPTGGLGANTGIQDAHNLAWKLAAVLCGQADAALLDSYHDERQPIGFFTMRQALARWGSRIGEGSTGEAEPLLDYGTVAFGYRYRSDAVLDGPVDDRLAFPAGELCAQPGTRAPHVWLERDGERISTVDLFGRGFVLLTDEDGEPWLRAARAFPGADLAAYCIGDGGELSDPGGCWPAAYGVGPGGAVLVRPDGVVAWRSAELDPNPPCRLGTALEQVGATPMRVGTGIRVTEAGASSSTW